MGAAHDITPIEQWGKGRINAVRVITSEGDINIINVYAPAGNKDKKAHYYEKLTEWAQDLKGDLLLGGDWNMTLRQMDQKIKKYNKGKNIPLHNLDEKLKTRDVWRKLHRGEPTEYTWRRSEGAAQEK